MSDNVARQKQFKNTGKHEEMRRRRAEGSLELRKQRKEEQMMKRRNVDVGADTTDDEQMVAGGDQTVPAQPDAVKILTLKQCLDALQNGADRDRCYQAVESIRRHLSRQKQPPIDEVIKLGIVPYLVKALYDPTPKIQFEAAWALTNVTSGTNNQTMTVVNEGAIAPLVNLLSSPDNQVSEQCTWALGNITGESAQLRDIVVEAGLVDPLIKLAQRTSLTIDCLRTVAWTMSNICRYKTPQVALTVVEALVPALALLIHHPDTNVVCDVCWAFAYISDGAEERIDLVLKSGVLDRLIHLASGSDMTLIAPSLRCLGNIVTGDDSQTQAVIDRGILTNVLPSVLASNKPTLTRESCWLMSNVCAGNSVQIQAVLDSGLIPPIVHLLEKGDYRTQTESAWVIYNVCSGGTIEQSCFILQCGALTGVCHLLKSKEARSLLLTLDTMAMLLEVTKKMGQLEEATIMVEECGGLDQIEQLQNHENEDVYQKALQLVGKYFSEEEAEVGDAENGDTPIQFENPSAAPTGGFTF